MSDKMGGRLGDLGARKKTEGGKGNQNRISSMENLLAKGQTQSMKMSDGPSVLARTEKNKKMTAWSCRAKKLKAGNK